MHPYGSRRSTATVISCGLLTWTPEFKEQIGPSEYELGKIIIDSAVEAGIGHAVHASLTAATKLTNCKVTVLAFDGRVFIIYFYLAPSDVNASGEIQIKLASQSTCSKGASLPRLQSSVPAGF